MEKDMLLIYNPVSGKTAIKTHLADIVALYTNHDYKVTVHPTKCKLDGFNYIKENANKYDTVCICGGDGMLNEAVSALMHIPYDQRPPLSYLPSGSTNDFAGTVGLPLDLKASSKMTVEGSPFFCDAGQFNDKFFAYVAAFGAFTSVSYDTLQEFKNVFGHLAYILEAIRQLPTIKSYHVKVSYENTVIEDDFLFGMVTNSLQVGGIKHLSGTTVSLNDGLFEVLLVKKPQKASDLQNIITGVISQSFDVDGIIKFKASKVLFESDVPISWALDGEFGGDVTSACITNLTRAFSVIV